MKSSKHFFRIVLIFLTIVFSLTRVSAKDDWIKARSRNFQLISNADATDVRRVGNRLEQFREVFRQLFTRLNLNSAAPVNVVVFKDDASFRDFKPIGEDGILRDWVKGYFQSGEDVNYIVLSAEGENVDTYRTIFHEYVHFLVGNDLGRARVPAWFNEGLAGYYETVRIEGDRKVTFGNLDEKHLLLLRQNKLIPFETFFNTDNYSLRRQGADGGGLFYAQAEVLMHYLMQGKNGARRHQLEAFTNSVLDGKSPKEAFTEAFQVEYRTIERELEEYIRQKSFPSQAVILKDKFTFDGEMQSAPVSESEAKAVLGDLLYHTDRLSEAAALLEAVVKTDFSSSLANTTLGLVRLRQNDFAEAKKYLEKAVSLDDKNYLAHYRLAYVLSREGMTRYGFVSEYSASNAAKMRESLEKAIALNPNFAESYNLYAFVNIVRNEELDAAKIYLEKALKLAPGNQWYQIHLAELEMRKENFAVARRLAAKIYETAPDDRLRVYAKTTVGTIDSYEAQLDSIKNSNKNALPAPEVTDRILTEEELARLREKALLEAINQNLRRLKTNEKRVLGYLSKIECAPKEINYSIKINDEVLKLSSENFDSLKLMTFDADSTNGQVGCDTLKKEKFAVVTYRPVADKEREGKIAGEIISIEFVPKNFKFLN